MPDRGPTTAPLPETLVQSERSDSTYDGSFAGSGPFSAVSPRASFEPPERYQPEGLISSGSFGEIWRVRDRVLDRALAMKVLRVELVDSRHMRARFLGEARITADLQHPGIVAVHDQGELGDGRQDCPQYFTRLDDGGENRCGQIQPRARSAHWQRST